jgi:hypothetical protein
MVEKKKGQYVKPSGLFFGGRETQASSLVKLHAFLKDTFKAPKVVLALDIHAGLGPSGMDTLMVDSEELKASLFESPASNHSNLHTRSNRRFRWAVMLPPATRMHWVLIFFGGNPNPNTPTCMHRP